MPISDAFLPAVDSSTKTQKDVINVTTSSASQSTRIDGGNEILVKAWTAPAFIRLGVSTSADISSSNGYYIAAGDEVRWQLSDETTHLFYIRQGGSNGDLSIAVGTGS